MYVISVPMNINCNTLLLKEGNYIQDYMTISFIDKLFHCHLLQCLKESYVKALGTGIGYDLSKLNFEFKMDFLQENKVTTDTKLRVYEEDLSEWTFEEHSLDNHCIVVAKNQKVGQKHNVSKIWSV